MGNWVKKLQEHTKKYHQLCQRQWFVNDFTDLTNEIPATRKYKLTIYIYRRCENSFIHSSTPSFIQWFTKHSLFSCSVPDSILGIEDTEKWNEITALKELMLLWRRWLWQDNVANTLIRHIHTQHTYTHVHTTHTWHTHNIQTQHTNTHFCDSLRSYRNDQQPPTRV